MKNIIDICKDFGIEISADKHAEFNKAVAENYKTIAEHEKKVNRLTEDLNAEKEAHKTTQEALKGFEGLGNAADVKKQLEEANQRIKKAEDDANKKIAERDFEDALKTGMEKYRFTSEAAKRDILSQIRAKGLPASDGVILGLDQYVEQLKKANEGAFDDDAGKPAPKFTDPGGKTANPGGTTTLKDIMKIRDPVERQRMIGQNLNLFGKEK